MGRSVNVGDPAPDFTAVAADGRAVSLRDFRGQSSLVLFFYPQDGTAICTREACRFRDEYKAFLEAGAGVIGVSGDDDGKHQAFAAAHHLPFPLISDADGSLRRAFGVPLSLGMFPGRVTYVIDTQGVVRMVFNSQLQGRRHVNEALTIVRGLQAKSKDDRAS